MSFGVGVGDAIQLAKFIQELLRSYTNAPRKFLELSNYVQSLRIVLEELSNSVEGIDLSPNIAAKLQTGTANSHTLLEELNKLLVKRASLTSPKEHKFWDRGRWPSKQMDSLRLRLNTQTSVLLLLHQSILSFKPSERDTKLESKIDAISRRVSERRPPGTLEVKSKPLEELVNTFMPGIFLAPNMNVRLCSEGSDWYSIEAVRKGPRYYVNVSELVEAFVTFQWPDCEPVTMQVAGPDACAQLTELLRSPLLVLDFDRAFPGDRGIRKDIVNATSRHLPEYRDRASIIAAASAVMMLMFMTCHKRKSSFDAHLTDIFGHKQLVSLFRSRLNFILARTLMQSLQEFLWHLDHLMKRCRREDWPVAFVAMCFVLFEVECMTVNVHIFEPHFAHSLDQKVEMEGVQVLLDRFKAYTHGINPLELDWSMPKNQELVQMDPTTLGFSKSLQEVISQHWRFLQDRRTASYDQDNDNSYIGKIVSALMV